MLVTDGIKRFNIRSSSIVTILLIVVAGMFADLKNGTCYKNIFQNNNRVN